jgi:hypothetical protein
MTPGRRLLVPLLALLVMLLPTRPAPAQQIRTANVGDPISSLLGGLIPVNGGPVGVCAEGGPVIYFVNYLVPARVERDIFGVQWKDLQQDNASFLAYMAGDQVGRGIIMLVEFDEENPSVAAAVFADTEGNGRITSVWPAAQAPSLCSVAGQVRPRS